MSYTIDTCPNLGCGHCKFYRADADRNRSFCKRIDHKKVQFKVPWFKSYDCGYHHLICCDFQPAHPDYADFRSWEGFEDFWGTFVKAWLPYSNTDTDLPFIIDGNKDIVYHVKLMDFIRGCMFDAGRLRAYERSYYKRTRDQFGYKLIRESIDGISIV